MPEVVDWLSRERENVKCFAHRLLGQAFKPSQTHLSPNCICASWLSRATHYLCKQVLKGIFVPPDLYVLMAVRRSWSDGIIAHHGLLGVNCDQHSSHQPVVSAQL